MTHNVTGCPDCGGSRTIRTDGLTGRVTAHCEDCARAKERAEIQARFERNALERVARRYGVTVEELERRFGRAPRKVPVYQPKPCTGCGLEFRPTGPRSERCDECRGKAA